MFTFLIFSEVYYHLCNNRCGGVNGPPRNQMRHLRQVGGVKEINSDECDKECRLNCQTESKISAADEMGGGKLNPTMKKIFFRKYYGIRSSILKARVTLLTKIYDLAIRNHQTKRTDISQYEQMVYVVKCVALRS